MQRVHTEVQIPDECNDRVFVRFWFEIGGKMLSAGTLIMPFAAWGDFKRWLDAETDYSEELVDPTDEDIEDEPQS